MYRTENHLLWTSAFLLVRYTLVMSHFEKWWFMLFIVWLNVKETIFTRKVQNTIINSCPAVSSQTFINLLEMLWTWTAVGMSFPGGHCVCSPETDTADTAWLSVLLELTYLQCAHLCFPPTPLFTTFISWYVFHKHWETLHDACFCPRLQGLFRKPFCMWWVEIWQLVIRGWS